MKAIFLNLRAISASVPFGAALVLTACNGSGLGSEAGNKPFRAVAAERTTIVAVVPSDNEVTLNNSVRVRMADKYGGAVSGITPSITAVTSGGAAVPSITGSSCGPSDALGYANCTIASSAAGSFVLKVTSPVTVIGGGITFTQKLYQLAFSTQPASSVTAAGAFSAAVTLQDRAGTAITTGPHVGSSVTISLTTPGIATLTGGSATAAVAGTGIATFTNLRVNKSGPYTLTAASGAARGVSATFTVVADVATKMIFQTSPPADTPSRVAFNPQPVVALLDANDNVATTSTCTVTVTKVAGSGDGTLVGSTSVTSNAGLADFAGTNLRIDTLVGGGSYELEATTSCGFPAVRSSTFRINLSGVPVKVVVGTPPTARVSLMQTWPQQPVVRVLDINNQLVSTDNSTTVTITKTGGSPSGLLTGPNIMPVVNGVAAFAGLYVNMSAPPAYLADVGSYTYDVTAVNSGVTLIPYSITHILTGEGHRSPFRLEFAQQPTNVSLNQSQTVKIKKVDADGFLNFTENAETVVITKNSGAGTITATAPAQLINGQTTISDVVVTIGTGTHSLLATGSSAITGTSLPFVVSPFGTKNKLSFNNDGAINTSPGTGIAAVWNPTPIVHVQDVAGNLVSNDNSTSVAISCAAWAGSSVCDFPSGVAVRTAVNGVATFPAIKTNQLGLTNLAIRARASGLTESVSSSFTGNYQQPASVNWVDNLSAVRRDGGLILSSDNSSNEPLSLEILASGGARITSHPAITCTATYGPGASGDCSLGGTVNATASNGVVSFPDLSVGGGSCDTGDAVRITITCSGPTFTVSPSAISNGVSVPAP